MATTTASDNDMADAQPSESANLLKRKRSSPSLPSAAFSSAAAAAAAAAPPAPPQKVPKVNLQINYLARQSPHDLPLINKADTIPNILDVLSSYNSVLDRYESLASNLGARPLGPILIKRFERCFDGPPQIIASHSHAKDPSDSPRVTWLEVIQFAQTHPGQFTLSTFSEGRRVCQFYYPQKQVRVQVTEEDFLFIKSGRCQDLIPPLPIWEDEEKEVGTCEILEKQLRELTNAADTVAARTRQLSHRLKGRRMAIMERRAAASDGKPDAKPEADTYDPSLHERNSPPEASGHSRTSTAASGFTAVNNSANGTSGVAANLNGDPTTAPSSVRHDLLKHFQSLSQNQTPDHPRRPSLMAAAVASPTLAHAIPSQLPQQPSQQQPHPQPQPQHQHQHLPPYHQESDFAPPANPAHQPAQQSSRPDPLSFYLASAEPPPPVVTPGSQRSGLQQGPKHNFSRPLAPGQEISQPFRTLCQTHMESLPRGSRVMPPCDRCRRLKMDCLKNLTSCQGCTKKHARCHWKDVGRDEVEGLEGFGIEGAQGSGSVGDGGNGSTTGGDEEEEEDSDDEGGALEDLEALGRDEETELARSAERKGWQAEDAARRDSRGQLHTSSSANSTTATTTDAAHDRASDVSRGGLPCSHQQSNEPSNEPSHSPASVSANASTAATEHHQHEKRPSISFPPFEPPQQRAAAFTTSYRPPSGDQQTRSPNDQTSASASASFRPTQSEPHLPASPPYHATASFRPSSGFTSVNNVNGQPTAPPATTNTQNGAEESTKMDIDTPPSATTATNNISNNISNNNSISNGDETRTDQTGPLPQASLDSQRQQQTQAISAGRDQSDRPVSPFSAAAMSKPTSAVSHGGEAAAAVAAAAAAAAAQSRDRNPFEGVGSQVSVGVGGGCGEGGSSGWRGM